MSRPFTTADGQNITVSGGDYGWVIAPNDTTTKILDAIKSGQSQTCLLYTSMLETGNLEGVVISPGPKSPKDCGNCKEIVEKLAGKIPILGICLGHQIIGHVFGAEVEKGERPMHGKVTAIQTNQKGLFQGLPGEYQVTRYHSLVVSKERFPECLEIDASSNDGVIMGLHHRKFPIYGVQFHPEAVLTEYGHELLKNFTEICRGWWRKHENKSV